RVGGREQEFDVRRRLLERLQQRVEGVRGEHVHLIDEVDLVAAARRRVLHVVEQLAGIVDLGARRRVHLYQVRKAAGFDLAAARALETGLGRDASFAVETLGENARDRGLADTTGAGKQERMMYAATLEGIHKRPAHVVLTDELGEGPRTPFACQRGIAHGKIR